MADSSVNRYALTGFLAILAIIAAHQQAVGQQPERNLFEGEKTSWHGFDRYDFLMDEGALAEKRYQELDGRITVIIQEGEGHYPLAPKDLQPVVDFIIKSVAASSGK